VNQILHYVQSTPDQEVCGLISSKNGIAAACYPIANIAAQPATRFQLDPAAQIDAMRKMREQNEELCAIFHSHPTAPAQPSAQDIAESAYLDAAYLVISLNTKGVLEMRGFRIAAEQTVSELVLLMTAE
jgi:proteasome lid subunit RPN8/RPN11